MGKRIFKRLNIVQKNQAGQALILVLVFFLLGSLTLPPLLGYMSTALKTGTKYELKTNELITADAGIENGMWRIKSGYLGDAQSGGKYNPYNYDSEWEFYTDPLNDLTAVVKVKNIWIPTNIDLEEFEMDDPEKLEDLVKLEKLKIVGTAGSNPNLPFTVKMDFTPDAGDNLTITSIGVWLPQGFEYNTVECTCSLTDDPFAEYYPDYPPVYGSVGGGYSIVWNYTETPYPLFTSFPNLSSENGTLTVNFSFTYKSVLDDLTKTPVNAIAWMTCEMHDAYGNIVVEPNAIENIPLAWDTTTRYYKITSSVEDTKIESYSAQTQVTNLGNGIEGDYVATGNSLMIDQVADNYDIRDTILTSSDATVSTIPAKAKVESAYLYWSAYRSDSYKTDIFTDPCSSFTNWSRSHNDESQTRYPTGDISRTGTWDITTDMYTYIHEEIADGDTTCLTHGTTAGNAFFNFDTFDVPDDSVIKNLTVYVVAKDTASSPGNRIQPAVLVGGSPYLTSSISTDDTNTSYKTISYVLNTNPKTEKTWLADEINGEDLVNPLNGIGVRSTDASPTLVITQVYAVVNYSRSCWYIPSTNYFQAQGMPLAWDNQRTLTLSTKRDLTSYIPGCVCVTWEQTMNGLEPDDNMYFAFSGDDGATWSDNYVSFNGTGIRSPFYYVIPDLYVTDSFKIRFTADFNNSSEYATIRNFKITNYQADTSVIFKVEDEQYSFDEDGIPQENGEVTASTVQAFPSMFGAGFQGFSYAGHCDVTALIEKYCTDEEKTCNGNFKYTVGGLLATDDHNLSYAGWSLIIVYSSMETAGHYLYIRDVFSFNPADLYDGVNLDFDQDGVPGGDITGFVVPKPIMKKTGGYEFPTAARLTCFVGEGDDYRSCDWEYIKVTGQTGGYKYLSNTNNPWNNPCNGLSTVDAEGGIDIDTFDILWVDDVLRTGDTRLHIDMMAGGPDMNERDAYNLIYFILSVQNKNTTTGTGHYVIESN